MNNNQIIEPKTEYRVYRNGDLDLTDLQILTKLYLPMIGANAFALITSLWENDAEKHEHFTLMNGIGIDGGELYQARLKLEGAGLVQTFKSETELVTYLLAKPLNASAFFNNGLLSEILLEMVGESKYLDLAKELLPRNYDFSLTTETTHDFLEVYSVNQTNLTNLPDTIKQVQKIIPDESQPVTSQHDNLDFKLMLNILNNSFVNLDDIKKNHELFVSTNLLYGISEVSMAKLVEQATNLTNNHFDAQKFKLLVSRNNQINFKQTKTEKVQSNPKNNYHFDNEEQQLIQTAKNYAPLIFLSALKKEKNGFPTSSEERVVSQLVEKMVLKTDVINMLIYLLLVDRNNPTLNKNLVETIANDWAQNQIQSAEQALEQIKTRDSKISAEKNKRRQKAKQRTNLNVRETLPDWAKDTSTSNQTSKTSETKHSKESVEEMLKKFNEKK
ncbi:DnaD domain protein [Fructilactobacillus frigidiflavus]|uniref:DnaD domain protein n=1 Tax=Fructilactobacillus frigidiflavus TaxID=3242688 RepID=UPI003757F687